MSVAELIPTLKKLSDDDKRQVIRFLVRELGDAPPPMLKSGEAYPVWSPYDDFEAADVLKEMLAAERADHD